ncbi:hypothetical protein JTB14_026327 [Gonioctena quinquepunctata]|nr:hypothetical protein JTB14_026327 [Gonioctena quinquepunctata]
MTDESALPSPSNPKKRESARDITQLLVIIEKSDCDEFDDVESVVSMGWDSSDDGLINTQLVEERSLQKKKVNTMQFFIRHQYSTGEGPSQLAEEDFHEYFFTICM